MFSVFPHPRTLVLAAALGLALVASASAQTVLPPPTGTAQADAEQDRVEALQQQLQQATSENERLQHELALARAEVARLQGMVNDLTAANQQATQGPPSPSPTDSGSTLSAAQQAHVGQLGTMSANSATANNGQPPETAQQLYSRARQLLVAGNYGDAQDAFAAFQQRYGGASTPEPLRGDALYWYAYTLLAQNDYAGAQSNFVTYLQRYPNGARAPDAQVRLGMALAGQGQNRQACAAYNLVPRRYPHAAANVREQAAREAQALHCPAS